jgi:hypothetical protein
MKFKIFVQWDATPENLTPFQPWQQVSSLQVMPSKKAVVISWRSQVYLQKTKISYVHQIVAAFVRNLVTISIKVLPREAFRRETVSRVSFLCEVKTLFYRTPSSF